MRIITFNANGIRAAARKGFFDWLATQHADIVCIQETKAQEHQLTEPHFCPDGYYCYYVDAQKPGYSGVALYTRYQPERVITRLGLPLADDEGRYVQVDFAQLSVASIYLPSGTSGDARQQLKFQFLDYYLHHLQELKQSGRQYIICGDWNIAHKQIDLKNWRGNQKNSGFLPEERAWLDTLFDSEGYVDAFREVNQQAEQYTWWSHRGQAWAKNVGWRIDYQVLTPGLAGTVRAAEIYKAQRFSDHAPLIIDYDLNI
ncbi:MAG: exodeoxyribonuclease III [Gammaproteobacteria bacterium]